MDLSITRQLVDEYNQSPSNKSAIQLAIQLGILIADARWEELEMWHASTNESRELGPAFHVIAKAMQEARIAIRKNTASHPLSLPMLYRNIDRLFENDATNRVLALQGMAESMTRALIQPDIVTIDEAGTPRTQDAAQTFAIDTFRSVDRTSSNDPAKELSTVRHILLLFGETMNAIRTCLNDGRQETWKEIVQASIASA